MIRQQRRPLLLLAAGLVLCSYGLMWGLPNLFDFAQDSVVPCGTLAERGFEFQKITSYRYPPFHFWVLRVCFVPVWGLVSAASLDQNMKLSATLFIFAARVVSVAMALGTVWLLYATGRRLWDQASGLAGALVFILSPVTLYYAKNANLDIPYVFWLAWVVFLYVRILQEGTQRDYLWLGVVSALAVCTKDQAYGFILLLPVPILYRLFRRAAPEKAGARFAKLGLAAAGFLVPFVLVHNILFDWAGFWLHVKTILGPGVEPWREVAAGPLGQLRLLAETALRLVGAWTPAGVALVVIGLVTELRSREGRWNALMLLVPVISYYLSFVAVARYVYPRFVLPMMLILSLFAGRGVMWVWTRKSRPAWRPKVAAIAILAWLGLAGLSVDYVMSNYSRFDAQKWMEKRIAPGAAMCYVGDMRDMPRFNEPLDPHPCEPTPQAVEEARADVLVLSFAQGHPATGSESTRLASVARRNMGSWGRVHKSRPGEGGFLAGLVAGESGYAEVARFESPVSAFVPEVAASLNRTIIIMARRE